jgi:uncharacterized membrane protein YhaH (DUF805 family)
MLIRGTQIHIVTFSFILLEFCMFIWQMARYFYRLRDRHRGWYIMLLLLLLLYNVTNGLFPDPNIALPVKTQNMIAYGTTFIIISYFLLIFEVLYKCISQRANIANPMNARLNHICWPQLNFSMAPPQ